MKCGKCTKPMKVIHEDARYTQYHCCPCKQTKIVFKDQKTDPED